MRSPLIWYGGKGNLCTSLLKYVPEHLSHIEPFFGGGSLFFRKTPSKIETINDINSDVVNFFRLLQDKERFEKFKERIKYTPYSREVFNEARDSFQKYEFGSDDRVYNWFVSIRQSFSGNGRNWSMSVSREVKTTQRWNSCYKNLDGVFNRLRNTQIENIDFENVFKTYAVDENCFVYCDPPYVHSTRKQIDDYVFEMTDDDHLRFINVCLDSPAKIMISGYDNSLYAEHLKDWKKLQFDVICHAVNKKGKTKENAMRHEIIWMNYDITKCKKNLSFFD
jgi:DNA adenine methylase